MVISKAFGILIGAAITVAIAVVVLYRIFYQRSINRRLHDINTHSYRLLSPRSFTVITIFIVLLAFAALTTILALGDFGAVKVPQEYINAVYDYEAFSPPQMSGYLRSYAIDKIDEKHGYTKTVEQQGDMRFTYLVSDGEFDHYHPLFIIYAEYTGDKDILYYGVNGRFFVPNDMPMTGAGHAGSEFEDYVCIIGTSSVQARFEVNVFLFDSGIKGENMEDIAAVQQMAIVVVPGRDMGAAETPPPANSQP